MKNEFIKFSKVPANKIILLRDSQVKRVAQFKKAKQYFDGNMIVITNYEGLLMRDLFNELKAWAPEVMVLDESHYIKERTATRTKRALELSKNAQFKYILTGTPILNSELDLHQQILFLDRGERLGESWFSYRWKYFYDVNARMNKTNYFPKWVPKPNAAQEISKKIEDISIVAKKKDCLDLPPLVRMEIPVELTSEQAKAYESMRKDFITYLESGVCTAQLALTKSLRLLQIVSGYLPIEQLDDQENAASVHDFADTNRIKALSELLQQITPNSKVLVWCVFKQNYEQVRRLCEKLEIGFVECHGEISSKQQQEAVLKFQSDPSVRVFCGHPGSAGIGINLTAASYMVFFSRGYSLAHDLQAEARCHRGGSEIHEKITRIDIITPGTIDEVVFQALAKKEKISENVLFNLIKHALGSNVDTNEYHDRTVRADGSGDCAPA